MSSKLCYYLWCIPLTVLFIDDDEDENEEEVEEDEGTECTGTEDEQGEEDEDESPSSARPRRMSEVHISSRIKPIPPFSSLFLFAPTNKLVFSYFLGQCHRSSTI